MKFLTAADFPVFEFPLKNEPRKAILDLAHQTLLDARDHRSEKEVVMDTVVRVLARELVEIYKVAVEELHDEIVAQYGHLNGDMFRNHWGGIVLSTVFDRTPGVPLGYSMDGIFAFEHPVGGGYHKPWEHRSEFCEFMAKRAIKAFVSNRLAGQALSFFGIVASDLRGIGVPGYDPPERPDPEPIKTCFAKSPKSRNLDFDVVLGVIINH